MHSRCLLFLQQWTIYVQMRIFLPLCSDTNSAGVPEPGAYNNTTKAAKQLQRLDLHSCDAMSLSVTTRLR